MKETNQILSQIKRAEYAPVYLLMGTEPYFIDQVSNALIENVVDETARDFDLTIMYGKESHPDQIIEAAKRFPMLGKHQLIVVKEAQYLDRTLELLIPYLESPQPQTILVICYKNKVVDKRKKIYKAFQSAGVVLSTKPLYENQVAQWISEEVKNNNLKITPQSSALLIAYLGTELGKINSELNKLKHNLESNSEITPDLIERHIGISKDFNSFELQKALVTRNISHCYRIIQSMSANPSQHPLPLIIGALFNFFQRLFMFHSLSSTDDAPKILGVSPFFIKDYQSASQHFSMRQTAKVLEVLKEFDLKSKGVGADNLPLKELLKEMVLKIGSI